MTTNLATSCILNWLTGERAWLFAWQGKAECLPAGRLTSSLEQEFHDNLPEPDISLLESILHDASQPIGTTWTGELPKSLATNPPGGPDETMTRGLVIYSRQRVLLSHERRQR
ncbi:hypothetical protein [Bythopirellula goksoeyrii]|uniref:Uncharacterized protein n=1 Tax=Bythopirellula goksoeyrii TaxID=1400387 RepID=A0A5B9QPN8_9BACT|nr:hypothetical protein [Bythopirellula goksoeyrii]QEG36091.1 hypothetical protein Pr1d_34000 [Bythopirellula goksoeyrii]